MRCRFHPRLCVYLFWLVLTMVIRLVKNFRAWVGALHWGQLLLLLPSLLFVGVAVGWRVSVYANDVRDSARYEFDVAETALREDSTRVQKKSLEEIFGQLPPTKEERQKLLAMGFTEEEVSADQPRPLDTNLVRAVKNAQAAKERMESLSTWVRRVGMFGWAFAWLTAFLSLWWWFGARANPRAP